MFVSCFIYRSRLVEYCDHTDERDRELVLAWSAHTQRWSGEQQRCRPICWKLCMHEYYWASKSSRLSIACRRRETEFRSRLVFFIHVRCRQPQTHSVRWLHSTSEHRSSRRWRVFYLIFFFSFVTLRLKEEKKLLYRRILADRRRSRFVTAIKIFHCFHSSFVSDFWPNLFAGAN